MSVCNRARGFNVVIERIVVILYMESEKDHMLSMDPLQN